MLGDSVPQRLVSSFCRTFVITTPRHLRQCYIAVVYDLMFWTSDFFVVLVQTHDGASVYLDLRVLPFYCLLPLADFALHL